MNTVFVLMAQYNGLVVTPLEKVCQDYFTHLNEKMFERKVLAGQIKVPITRLEPSQKSAKGVHITDLAICLDQQRAAGLKEFNQLNGYKKASQPKAQSVQFGHIYYVAKQQQTTSLRVMTPANIVN